MSSKRTAFLNPKDGWEKVLDPGLQSFEERGKRAHDIEMLLDQGVPMERVYALMNRLYANDRIPAWQIGAPD